MGNASDRVLARIRSAIETTSINPPATPKMIESVERGLGVPFPPWLRSIYLACNGFCGPTGVGYLWPLEGEYGVEAFTHFLRNDPNWPDWLDRAIVFSDNGVGGTITVHWAALDGKLIEWCYGDNEAFTILNIDLFELWAREQKMWDEIRQGPESN